MNVERTSVPSELVCFGDEKATATEWADGAGYDITVTDEHGSRQTVSLSHEEIDGVNAAVSLCRLAHADDMCRWEDDGGACPDDEDSCQDTNDTDDTN